MVRIWLWGERRYTAYAGAAKGSRGASIVYLVDDTFYKQTLEEYTESRPACLIIVIDSYDELFDDMKDSEQAKELEAINSLLETYIGRSTGFLRRVSNSRYIAVVEERDVRWMIQERFDILDKVRALHPGGLTTLSIGVGHGGKTLQECHQMARESIDIALGRGGDQAAVKTVDGFEFYGGISHGVEKRSHVRSRIISRALCDLIKRSDSVIIMGHRMSDLDAVGSAIGVLRICKMCRGAGCDRHQQRCHAGGAAAEGFSGCRMRQGFLFRRIRRWRSLPQHIADRGDTYQVRLLESQKITKSASALWSSIIIAWRWDTSTSRFCCTMNPMRPVPANWIASCCSSCRRKATSRRWRPRHCWQVSCWIPAVLPCTWA